MLSRALVRQHADGHAARLLVPGGARPLWTSQFEHAMLQKTSWITQLEETGARVEEDHLLALI